MFLNLHHKPLLLLDQYTLPSCMSDYYCLQLQRAFER